MNGSPNARLQARTGHADVDEGSSVDTRPSATHEQDQWPTRFVNVDDTGVDRRVREIRNLSSWDVAALITNKMIGTGIFTGPSIVLQFTLNKKLAIGLWAFGMVYTLLSMILYIEYARKLPFTGGELVYVCFGGRFIPGDTHTHA